MPRDRAVPKPQPRKRVGIWIRVSTDDQAKGESPEHHERRARAYAESKDWEVIELYDLAGVSGKNVMHHPECRRMLADIASGRIEGLIFSKLARLARDTKQLLEFREYFIKYGADMISLADSIDTSTPAGRLFYTMNAAVAQWEREEISDRIAASVPIRAKMGKSLGGVAPFGYKWIDKKIEIEESEAAVRRRVYDLFLEHQRKYTVAQLMNEAGFRLRNGKLFSYTAVARILSDPIAVGKRRQNARHSKGRGGALKPAKDWVYIEVPAIISEETFEAVQAVLKSQDFPQKRIAKKTVHLFAGFVFCQCGNKMYVPNKGVSYICSSCRNKVGKDDLELVFNSQLKDFFFSPEKLAELAQRSDEGTVAKRELLETLKSERAKLMAESDKLYHLYQEGNISGRGFSERNSSLEERLEQLDREVPSLQADVDFLKIELLSSGEAVAAAQDLQTRWPKLSRDEKRGVIEAITDRIVVRDNEIAITLSYVPNAAKPPPTPSWKDRTKSPHTLASAVEHSNFLLELCPEMIAFDLQVVASLQIEPEPIAGPKIPCESKGGIGTDRAGTMHNLVDAPGRHANVLGQSILGNGQGLEKVEREHFAWVNRSQFALRHGCLSDSRRFPRHTHSRRSSENRFATDH
jgi:site-specific DNA recombinase